MRPAYAIQATQAFESDDHAPGTFEGEIHYMVEWGSPTSDPVRRSPELGPKRVYSGNLNDPFRPLVLEIKGRRFRVTVTPRSEWGEYPEPGVVTFEETGKPETPFEVWDPRAILEARAEELRRYVKSSTASDWERRELAEIEQDLEAEDYSGVHPGTTTAFGQPVFIQGPCFPTHEGKAAYHLLTFDTGWGDCGNENYMVALDDDGYPVAVFHEASCS